MEPRSNVAYFRQTEDCWRNGRSRPARKILGKKYCRILRIQWKKKLQEKEISTEEVVGIGVGVPGPVNSQGDVIQAVNLFWGYKKVAEELEALTGIPAMAGNDANVAALGEAWKGAAAGEDNVVMVTLGTGVGGGIIVNGRILSGTHGAGGEIGHMNVNHEETESCNCGIKDVWNRWHQLQGLSEWRRKS